MTSSISPQWGLRHDITPCFGARLVQERNRLHYLGDHAGLYGKFAPEQLRALDRSFPVFIDLMEAALRCGELEPHNSRGIRFERERLVCEADTRGSCGYVYVTIYPAPASA
ncbi:type IV toxin-antitoxin system YeeU family antitoxin [Trabulsiella odontotermitis]|uniref:type IV toxin-antitoxin system YeeU family antitoxin n=1 Tax=Enterobacteriaceae TaxID=543 RepID=UPI000CD0658F|nr:MULTISPECIES: type IV toxin-antitoxin system YeeU family antitoxin [Enterobacteriaceae]AUV04082.1 antitoxin YeeU [Enterobacteriaceae bacterium ENNIH1]MDU6684216.1 type IV toxin-antitoxin system YeeU family antitoxin [Enterobacteriaceae bacterium]WHP32152.1 type IV toxin-antitoxin system YeeU family antitoxin [Trabulsiella odontotermitis]